VTAAGLTDVCTRDLQPLVLGRGRQHPLQQLPVTGLQFGLLLQLSPGDGDPHCQRIADRLELTEAECSRLFRDGRDPGVDLEARKSVGEK